jgi:tetratricopeptide (TPR) repeat protein
MLALQSSPPNFRFTLRDISPKENPINIRDSHKPKLSGIDILFIEGIPEYQCSWIQPNWVIHKVFAFIDNSKHLQAAIDSISFKFYSMRHIQRGIRFLQNALHTKKNKGKKDYIIRLWASARAEFKNVPRENFLNCLYLLETDLNLAAEIGGSDKQDFEKVTREINIILKRLSKTEFSPGNIAFRKFNISKLIDGIARAFDDLGQVYETQGLYEKALESKLESLYTFENLSLGKNTHDVGAMLLNVGNLFLHNLDLHNAICFYNSSLYMFEELTQGKDDEIVAIVMENVAVIKLLNDEFTHENIDLLRMSYEMNCRLFGDRNYDGIGCSLSTLGFELSKSINLVEGIELLLKGLAMNKRFHPLGGKYLAENLTNLGKALLRLRDPLLFEVIQDLLEEGIYMLKKVLKSPPSLFDQEKYALIRADISEVKNLLGNNKEALEDRKNILEDLKRIYRNEDNVNTAKLMYYVAESLMMLDDKEEVKVGISMIRNAISMFQRLNVFPLEMMLAQCVLFPLDPYELSLNVLKANYHIFQKNLRLTPKRQQIQICNSFIEFLNKYDFEKIHFTIVSEFRHIKYSAARAENIENKKIIRMLQDFGTLMNQKNDKVSSDDDM